MRRTAILLAVAILALSIFPRVGVLSCKNEGPSRAVSFIEVGETAFDQTSAPTFISAVDWNNDGYTDLLFNGYRLFRNNGPPSWDFTLQTPAFNGSTSGARNGVWADWDGDGDQDLYQGCNKGTADRFWENQGYPEYRLEDVSRDVFGRWQNLHPNTGNAWGDYDRDGDLDLYVGNGEDWNDGNPIYFPDYFLRNEKGLTLTEISSSVGIRTGENFYSRGVTWGDYNNDHWQDAYVSHYRIRENHLFENQQDGTFDEVGQERNCSGTYDTTWYYDSTQGRYYGPMWGHTIGSSWADFNRDGNLDLWTSDFVHKYVGYIGDWYDIRGYICDDGNLYINDGAPYYTFTDHRNTSGIPKWPIGGSGTYQGDQTFSGVTIGDYDNDGWEDIYIPQVYGDLPYTTPHLYRNKGVVADGSVPDGTTFEDVTDTLGIKGANTYANLWVDYDNDGDLDLVTGGGDTWNSGERKWENYRVRLYQNQITGSNQWLKIKLNGTGSNSDAVGARVILRYNWSGEPQLIMREVRAGTGHAHQESPVLHFGLGDLPLSDSFEFHRLEVHWPDGLVQSEDLVSLNSINYIGRRGDFYPPISGWGHVTPIYEEQPIEVFIVVQDIVPVITGYHWDLDSDNHFDRFTSSHNVSVLFHHSGLKHIRCRIMGENGLARDVYPIDIFVPNSPPVVDIKDLTIEMDTELILNRDTILDSPSDLVNLTWEVDWGDGEIINGSGRMNGSHIYTIAGTFTLKITASDESEEVIERATIEVLNVEPWGWVEPIDGNDTTYLEDEQASFRTYVFDTVSDTGYRSFKWDFGDGNVTEWRSRIETGWNRYERSGEYHLKVYVKDQYGGEGVLYGKVNITNPPPTIELADDDDRYLRVNEDKEIEMRSRDFIFSDTKSDLDLLKFKWDFGDGNVTESTSSPAFSYLYERSGTYMAFCSVRDDDGATDILHINIQVDNPAPWIKEISSVEETYEDELLEIVINGRDTLSDRAFLNYELEFPDGRILESMNGTFQFSIPEKGYYDLVARVIDDDGAFDEKFVYVNILNRPPNGNILVERNSYDEDQEIQFQASDIWDTPSDLPNVTISWDFNDNSQIQTGTNAVHTYNRKGRYIVRMTINDGDDRTVIEKDIIINNPIPTAHIHVQDDIVSYDLSIRSSITFHANESTDNPSDLDSLICLWDFDDGEEAEGKVVTHQFKEPGKYSISLQVIDDDGAIGEDAVEIEFFIGNPPPPDDNGAMNTAMLISISGGGLLLIVLLVLGGLLLLKKRQQPPQPLPPPQGTMSLLPRGSTKQNVAQLPPKAPPPPQPPVH